MPRIEGTYIVPNWEDDTSPPIEAAELTDMGTTIAENQADIAEFEDSLIEQEAEIAANTEAIETNAEEIVDLKTGVLVFQSIIVPVDYWGESTVYTGFGFSATFACTGVTDDYVTQVIFAPTEAMNGNYAPIATPGTNTVTIYAVAEPVAPITIPTVIALKQIS
jgi:hypothetical protein